VSITINENIFAENKLKSWPIVAIVVLNWNNYMITNRCIESMRYLKYPNYIIYLVDNCSSDNSMQRLVNDFKTISKINFVFNEANLGFAAGCNRGIKKAIDEGADYILLLNNDCIVFKNDFLNKAIVLAESDKKIGILGGKILFWPEKNRIWSTGGYISFWFSEKHIGYNKIDKGQYDIIADRQFISGALMLVKRNVFKKIGLLPEAYFFGKEEWEFSALAIKSGYRLIYCPDFSIYHEASNSHDWTDPTYVYNGALSKIIFKKRNFSKFKYFLWYTLYKVYVKYLFNIKYYFQKSKYLQGIPAETIRQAMLFAVNDAPSTEKITENMLSKFRRDLNIANKV